MLRSKSLLECKKEQFCSGVQTICFAKVTEWQDSSGSSIRSALTRFEWLFDKEYVVGHGSHKVICLDG